jgi:UDP-N-acetylglucosamine--N-acetylmuramyl-(pentapeptide) pyrophosphoryl-undecaprenol N-acetylglucosamine transferase
LPFVELFGDRGRPSPLRFDLWVRATRRLQAALAGFDPDVVVVLGGWVALPALWLHSLPGVTRRPTVLVEPNAIPGKVGRLLNRRVDHTCLALDTRAMPRGRQSTTITGVPGPALSDWSRVAAAASFGLDPELQTLLVTGGSQGARDVNQLVPAAVECLIADPRPWQVLHITGPAHDDPPERFPVPVARRAFVPDMSAAWALADLALCRAGSGTICELQASGTPALLVPYPHHRDRHQAANAAGLVERGAALMVAADDPTGARTGGELLARALHNLDAMTRIAGSENTGHPARSVAEVIRRASVARAAGAASP